MRGPHDGRGVRLLPHRRAQRRARARGGEGHPARTPPVVTGPFAAGERVMLVDTKRRHYLVTLRPGGEFHSHRGVVAHDTIIGLPEGSVVVSTRQQAYTALRPTLEDI